MNWALARSSRAPISVQRAVIYDASGVPVEVDDSAVGVGPDGQWRGPLGQALALDADGSFHEVGSATSQAPQAPGTDLASTHAAPEEVPASFALGGLPAFRYNLPRAPIASAHLETPTASIDVDLSLIGNVSVTFPNPPPGVSTDLDTGGWRFEATTALGGLTEGLRVNGVGTATPSIGVTLGSRFDQTEVRFTPPNTMAFRGLARIAYSRPSPLGPVSVQGQPGFELRVTVTPHPTTEPEAEPVVDEESWFERNRVPLAVIGVVALAAIAVALAPETGGASLVLLAE